MATLETQYENYKKTNLTNITFEDWQKEKFCDIKEALQKIKTKKNMVTFSEVREILKKWNIKYTWYEIAKNWSETHRFYHTLDHLFDLFDQIDAKYPAPSKEREILILTALFHDIIYNPTKEDNEEKSAAFFLTCCGDLTDEIMQIHQMILQTKNHHGASELATIFNVMDMAIVTRDLESLMQWEEEIREECSVYPNTVYQEGRLKFLKKILEKYPQNRDNILALIHWVSTNY